MKLKDIKDAPAGMTPSVERFCTTINGASIEELTEATSDREVVYGPYRRELPGVGIQCYVWVRMTPEERKRRAVRNRDFVKDLRSRGWEDRYIGRTYIWEAEEECLITGVEW
jgi:hypothetical protein